jgi:hypothetical protein
MNRFVNLCWVMGHLIGAGILNGLIGVKTEWGWRIPFALQVCESLLQANFWSSLTGTSVGLPRAPSRDYLLRSRLSVVARP